MTLSRFWVLFFAFFLSFAWLLPNHTLPWLGFHGDAWAACIMSIVALVFALRIRSSLSIGIDGVALLIFCFVPLVQFSTGIIYFFGTAWINFAYLIGFASAFVVGFAWSRESSEDVDYLVFSTVLFAGLVSFFLQLNQLFGADYFGEWGLRGLPTRQFANMAQPNQLASLQMLAILAVGWGYSRKYIAGSVAFVLACILISGLVLTESRTAWLTAMVVFGLMILRQDLWSSKKLIISSLILLLIYFLFVSQLPLLYQTLGHEIAGGELRSITGDPRWAMWQVFLEAAERRSLVGYGFGQIGVAQFEMLDNEMILGGSYLQSHNLFLDLVLWLGMPMGLSASLALVVWLVIVFFGIKHFNDIFKFSAICVLLIHSMLEYPLQYAYFLLPFGLVAGSLSSSVGVMLRFEIHRNALLFIVIFSSAVLSITVVDYFKVEKSFYGLRFELKKVETDIPKSPPDVLALTQWAKNIEYSRIDVRRKLNDDELMHLHQLVETMPSAYLMYKYATALTFNGDVSGAGKWLRRICQTSPIEHCESIKTEWISDSLVYPEIKLVPFPSIPD